MSDHALHCFDPVIASDVGVVAAVVFFNIAFWCKKNEAAGQNLRDGKVWTYKSVAGLARQFSYLSEHQIRYSLDLLVEKGYLIRGNYNGKKYDRTKWYAVANLQNLSENLQLLSENLQLLSEDLPLLSEKHTESPQNLQILSDNLQNFPNGFAKIGKPIPYKAEDKAKDKADICKEKSKEKKFTPPTLDELHAYCLEKGLEIDCEYFIDYYTSNGWVVGKNKMKDWRATARNWARRDKDKPKITTTPVNEFEALKDELARGGSLF